MSLNLFGRTAPALFLAFFAANLAAQTLTITPSGPVNVGTSVTFQYSDPSKAGMDIVVTATGGVPATTDAVVIHLDADGKGSGTWTVKNWRKAYINAPGCVEQRLMINQTPKP
jgi:hypothetical protein